mmetsp:Transcript_29991/g.87582  ORF Transcript_29991/g.87582 Transcript_29991/m.87582 type:complete len:1682 (-) Transcript_29991:2749-7794(-)
MRRRQDQGDQKKERGRSRDRADDYEQDYSYDRGGAHRRGRSPLSRSNSREDSYYGGNRGGSGAKRARSRSSSRDERGGSMAAATPSSGYASSSGWGEYGYGEGITGTHASGMSGGGDTGPIAGASSSWVDDHRHPGSSSGYHSSHSMSSYNSGYHSSQSATGTWGAGQYDGERSRGRSRGQRSRSPSTSDDDRSRDYSRERTGGGGGNRSRSRDSSRERATVHSRSQSWDSRERSGRDYSSRDRDGKSSSGRSSKYGDGSIGRKRSLNETAAASFSPLVHDNGVGKDASRRRRRDRSRQQLSALTPYDVLSDREYVAAVCGKGVQGDATRRILPNLLDVMGMEIVQQQQPLPSKIGNDRGGEETDSKTGEAEVLDTMNAYVRPKNKNPDHTPATVREFALTQISVRSSLVGGDMETENGEKGEHSGSVLDEILSAFRLAAHHTIIYADEALGGTSSSSVPAERKQKIADIARRALMTCFVTLRGLLLRLAELADAERNEGKHGDVGSIGVVFGDGFEGKADAGGAPTVVEGVLLDIVPLLTQFIHPPLGEKRALSLLQNLLSLDETARKKKRSSKVDKKRQMSQEETTTSAVTPLQTYTVIVRDSLMEVFVRQLFEQEGEAKRKLGRELLNVAASGAVSKTDGGAVAALRSKMTCPEVQDVIKEHRNSQTDEMEQRRRIAEAQNGGPSWDHEYQPFATKRKRTSSRTSADNVQEDVRLLRMDGCIYLSRIAARILTKKNAKSSSATSAPEEKEESSQEASEATDNLAPTPQPSVHTPAMTPSSSAKGAPGDGNIEGNQDSSIPDDVQLASMRPELSLQNAAYDRERLPGDDVQAQRERICSLAYFLFHTLMNHYAQAESDGYSDTITIHREDISSASLACYLLAGKMEECPVKVRTLLSIIKPVGLPPPPSARIEKCCERLKDSIEMNDSSASGKKLSLEWGKPTPEVMKQYELKLLSILGFDFSYGEGWIHPSTCIAELGEVLALDTDAVTHVESVMNDPSYTHSSLCLLGEPDLVAAAIYYLSCDKTDRELHKHWEELLDEDDSLVKLVANYAWEVRNCARAREKQWQNFAELKVKFDALRRSTKQHSIEQGSHPPNGDAHDANMLTIPSVLDLDVDISSNDSLPVLRTLSDLVDEMKSYLTKSDDLDGSAADEAMIPVNTLGGGAADAVADVDDALPIQELRLPNGAATEVVLSVEKSQGSSEMEKTDDADDDLADAPKSTPIDIGSVADIEGTCAADTINVNDTANVAATQMKLDPDACDSRAPDEIKMKGSPSQADDNDAPAGIEVVDSSEAPAPDTVSSDAATSENTATTARAKSPVATTPVPPVPSSTTPIIMSEPSKSALSSAASDRAMPSPAKILKMPVQSKRGLDSSSDQKAEQEAQSKRRMLKMPTSRSIPTALAAKIAIALPQTSVGSQQAAKPQASPSKSQSSRKAPNKKTSPNSRSDIFHLAETSAAPSRHSSAKQASKGSKRKQRSSPGGNNGQAESSLPQTASPQSKRKRQSPGEQPTSNQALNQVSSPCTKRQKANEAPSRSDRSNRPSRRPKVLLGNAFDSIMSHLGVAGGGVSAKHRQVPQENKEGVGSIPRPPTSDDNSPSLSPRDRAAQKKTDASKTKKQNKKGKGGDMNSVSYHFTLDDVDSPSPPPRGRGRAAAQKSTKAKHPKKKYKKSKAPRKRKW